MPRQPIPPHLRRRVRQRAKDRGEYCHYPQVACYAAFHCDHFVPQSQGGSIELNNLVFACPTCNASKHAQLQAFDRITGQIVPLFNPRIDDWNEHFRWSANGLILLGKTPSGRVTIRQLRMNRRGVAIIRSMLVELGLHPID